MAYVAFDEAGVALHPSTPALASEAEPTPSSNRLSALEWSVVAIARNDPLSSLRTPGRLSTAMSIVFRQGNPRLADERLEALRRMAVLAWHHSFQVAASEVRAFLDAGFTVGQYEALMGSISAGRQSGRQRR